MNRKNILGLIGWLCGAAIMTYFFLAPTAGKGGYFSSDAHFVALLLGGLLTIGSSLLVTRNGK